MSDEKLKALKCDSCGGDIVKSYRVVDVEEDEQVPIAKCLSCGQEYDQFSQEYYEFFADDFTQDIDASVFKLGLKGTLNGIEYEIIGRIRIQEEDDEDVATWDEWLAISTDGVYHYFVEEDGEVKSYEDYIPESIDLESDPDYIEFDGKRIDKDEGYIGRIVYAEGELTWEPEIGEPVTCYDIKKDGVSYSVEQSEGEVNITKGDDIPYKDIIAAFGTDEHKQLYESTTAKRSTYKKKAYVYLALLAASLSMAIYNCSMGSPVKDIMAKKKVITNNQVKVEKRKVSYFSQVLYGPFKMEKKNQLYDVSMSVNTNVQRFYLEWQSIRLMLLKEDRLNKVTGNKLDLVNLKTLFKDIDAKKEPVESFAIIGDFWDEAGVDSEGYSWHENDLTATKDFVLDEAGNYYFYLEMYNKKPRKTNSVNIKMATAGSVRYYIIFMFIFMILWLINWSKSKSYNELPFEMSD
ncbi:MAG: DUF4178 domain-containing protein [bacterium]|nr:DUF4178 domain-containing protein [bacterium]